MGNRKPDTNDAAGDATIEKAGLRRDMRQQRLQLTDRAERSELIWSQLSALPEVVAATRILAFSPVPGEPEIASFVDWATRSGKQVAVPEDDVDPTWPEVVVVPGLAFTADGHRLGQGGGWYDRFLASVAPDCTTIGVGFAEQILDAIPTEAHDITLDLVITDVITGTEAGAR